MELEILLQELDFSPSLSRCYIKLLGEGASTPANLSVILKESRTNTYKLLDELVRREVARRIKVKNKFQYEATSPVQLITLAREKKDAAVLHEKHLQQQLPNLLKQYYKHHEQPGIRFFQGKNGIREIFAEQIRIGKPIQFFKTRADIEFFGFQFMHEVRGMAPKAGIPRKAFTPDGPEVPVNIVQTDAQALLTRTWYEPEDYTAPVEWSVFGDKVSVISFGEEAIGMIIDSPQIAESLRQMFSLLDEGLRRRPHYKDLPYRGTFKDVSSFVEKHHNSLPDPSSNK